jgi:hypothetical protein
MLFFTDGQVNSSLLAFVVHYKSIPNNKGAKVSAKKFRQRFFWDRFALPPKYIILHMPPVRFLFARPPLNPPASTLCKGLSLFQLMGHKPIPFLTEIAKAIAVN